MKNTLLVIVAMLFAVSASAAGTSVSSGFSHTVGASITKINQHGSYNSSGSGISIAHSRNSDGSDFRVESYAIEVDTDTSGRGVVIGGFSATNYSSSAGILTANTGTSNGVSIKLMKNSAHTDVDVNGSYTQTSRGDWGYNRESGSFNSHDHEYTRTKSASVTSYGASYSSVDFNY